MKFVVVPEYKVTVGILELIKKGSPVFRHKYSKYNCAYLTIPPDEYKCHNMLCLSASKEKLPDLYSGNLFDFVNFFRVDECNIYLQDVELASCSFDQRFSMFETIWRIINYD